MTKRVVGPKVKCADWRYFAETVKREHEAHEWWDPCRGIRRCPGVTATDINKAV